MIKPIALAIALLSPLATALAAPAQIALNAPSGFFRTQLGQLEVTALADGVGTLPAALLHGDPARVAALLADDDIDAAAMPVPVNAYLVKTPAHLILVDAGTGLNWGPDNLGHVIDNLRAAGYRPSQVDMILITHVHVDHVGGLVSRDGKALFPRAVVRMAQADSDFWLSEKNAAGAPPGAKVFFDVARKSAAPYLKAGRWQPLRPGEVVDPAVTVVPLTGHTPGHVGFRFESQGRKMLVWGDTVHTASVQMAAPATTFEFDIDSGAAAATRAGLFAELASSADLVAGAHMPFPGFGRVKNAGAAYRWAPTPYAALPRQ